MSAGAKKQLVKVSGVNQSRDRKDDAMLTAMFDMDSARHGDAEAKAPDEGNLVISILPGDELGEFYVTVQYDGAEGHFGECIQRQGAQLDEIWKQVKGFLENHFGKEFEADIFTALPPGAPPGAVAELPAELRVHVSRHVQPSSNVQATNLLK